VAGAREDLEARSVDLYAALPSKVRQLLLGPREHTKTLGAFKSARPPILRLLLRWRKLGMMRCGYMKRGVTGSSLTSRATLPCASLTPPPPPPLPPLPLRPPRAPFLIDGEARTSLTDLFIALATAADLALSAVASRAGAAGAAGNFMNKERGKGLRTSEAEERLALQLAKEAADATVSERREAAAAAQVTNIYIMLEVNKGTKEEGGGWGGSATAMRTRLFLEVWARFRQLFKGRFFFS